MKFDVFLLDLTEIWNYIWKRLFHHVNFFLILSPMHLISIRHLFFFLTILFSLFQTFTRLHLQNSFQQNSYLRCLFSLFVIHIINSFQKSPNFFSLLFDLVQFFRQFPFFQFLFNRLKMIFFIRILFSDHKNANSRKCSIVWFLKDFIFYESFGC